MFFKTFSKANHFSLKLCPYYLHNVSKNLPSNGSAALKMCYSTGIEVKMDVIFDGDENEHPQCPHGPTFLFKKTDAKRRTSRKFFGCSANRSRKFCQFFHWANEPITKEKRKIWDSVAKNHLASLDLDGLRTRQALLENCPPETHTKFCGRCCRLLLPHEWSKHASHGHLEGILHERRHKPTSFLPPMEQNKTNAQYFFSDNCVQFIVDSLQLFEMKKVLCIGTPRVLEHIMSKKELGMDCLLMDIDHRYMQFYNSRNFILYNLFNHHFFEGHPAYTRFLDFVSGPERTVLVIDPPFGGMVSAIANTIRKISSCQVKERIIPILLFFPYFNEDRITQEMPYLKMLDYKVNYSNHEKFKEGGLKQGSVVRIYTNLDLEKFVLPASEGYRFCSICNRYVSKENKHCPDCNSCTSKDGRVYKHCQQCERCCKGTWEHCPVCNRCALPSHVCEESTELGSGKVLEQDTCDKKISKTHARTHKKHVKDKQKSQGFQKEEL